MFHLKKSYKLLPNFLASARLFSEVKGATSIDMTGGTSFLTNINLKKNITSNKSGLILRTPQGEESIWTSSPPLQWIFVS